MQIMKTVTFDMPCYMTQSYQNVGIASCINLELGFEALHQPSAKWPYRALVNAYLKASICSDSGNSCVTQFKAEPKEKGSLKSSFICE